MMQRPPSIADADAAGLAERLGALLAAPPRPVMVPMRRAGAAAEAARIVERDEYAVQHHPPVRLAWPVRWDEDPLGDRNWRFWFQAMSPVSYLVQGFEATGDGRFLERARELVEAWIGAAIERGWANDATWHDHGTALRALALLFFWETWRRARPDEAAAGRVAAALAIHARRLAEESFYRPRHNHGLDQARALLALGMNLAELPEADGWVRLARQRVAGQIAETILPDGVHFEHTPEYQGHVYMMLAEMECFLEQHGAPWGELRVTMGTMMRYMTHCLRPDGCWPNLGDTTPRPPTGVADFMRERGIAEPEFSYALSGGREGTRPAERDLILPASGCAIFRETWEAGRGADAVQIQFAAAFNTPTHKHHDDLSFVVHGFGHELLIDAGKFKYDYQHPMRRFCESGWGHNGIVRKGVETDLVPRNIGRSGITAVLAGHGTSAVEGEHHLFAGAVVRRLLVWVRPDVIVVIDTIEERTPREYHQLFNIGPDFETRLDGNEAIATCGADGPVMRLLPVWPVPPRLRLVRGQEEPPRGWLSRRYGLVEPVTTVMSTGMGGGRPWVTIIRLEERAGPAGALRGAARLDGAALRVTWTAGEATGELRYERTASEVRLECGESLAAPVLPLPYRRRSIPKAVCVLE